ncbi:zinc finger protein 239-like [Adelges cooleyi]|uniref:zinc finger protein 239-like n=2 Tax=Adelges cooleyi TaxID=133065 RepID=UPI0021807E3E|nr:zinc finger protein 239-like [Adelges cooleyi]
MSDEKLKKPVDPSLTMIKSAIKLEVGEVDKDHFFKSEIKTEENEDLSVVKEEFLDLHYTDFVESNFDAKNIKIENTEAVNSSDLVFLVPEPLFTGDTFNTIKHDRFFTEEEPSTQEELIMSNEKLIQRTLCSRTFAQPKKHENLFQCEVFSQQAALSQSGNLKTHTGYTPLQCSVCLKKFSQYGSLKMHNRTHTGEKPFQCEVCLKTFSQSGNLKTHKRTHTGERPFQCEICLETFSYSGYLKTHKRSHTGERPFQCEICLETFSQHENLKLHKRTHAGEKPFNCELCFKAFSVSSYLNKHRMTHTGERSFQCKVCLKAFSQPGHLIMHKRTHWVEKV